MVMFTLTNPGRGLVTAESGMKGRPSSLRAWWRGTKIEEKNNNFLNHDILNLTINILTITIQFCRGGQERGRWPELWQLRWVGYLLNATRVLVDHSYEVTWGDIVNVLIIRKKCYVKVTWTLNSRGPCDYNWRDRVTVNLSRSRRVHVAQMDEEEGSCDSQMERGSCHFLLDSRSKLL